MAVKKGGAERVRAGGSFSDEFVRKITEITPLEKIDYIIVNHVEMDHSSSLPLVAKLAKNAKILSSARGKEELIEHFGQEFSRVETVKTGDQLNLGTKTLHFVEAPMLHWPDSKFTYIAEDKILMPNDAFGQHLASSERFDDEVDEPIHMEEATMYYANILMPLAPLITRKIQEVVAMKIPIDIIAPSHGIIWRKDPMKIVNARSHGTIGSHCSPPRASGDRNPHQAFHPAGGCHRSD